MVSVNRLLLAALVSLMVSRPMSAATRAYFVEPKTAASGWSEPGMTQYVGQTFVANVDSIRYIEWFVGDLGGAGLYQFEIREQGTNDLICRGEESIPARGWQWVRCDSFYQGSQRFTKGKEYLLKVSHSAGESLCFVYRTDNPYGWGEMEVSGGQSA